MEKFKLIRHLKQICEAETMRPSYEEECGQWFDKWEQSDCEARGYSEGYSTGYIKAMETVVDILIKEQEIKYEPHYEYEICEYCEKKTLTTDLASITTIHCPIICITCKRERSQDEI